ncbi:uncharacterized protein E0L32_012276 [Thyridium curvatum]|uniref:DUF5672 domain-containing protein n=1 Tax=Thyridium curvatum TaxID=1093900 RepID=A0A507BC15_9PEZI|nr:uncharacterized protein E0L32_012276 [Thyridium curvatum]TPX17063.1 hypothetical protein E0L32_012276 [Thyridium curvatum]
MLHFTSVVPPEWRFRFMGSDESVAHINRSAAIREQVSAGKLDLTFIPANQTTGSQEEINRFFTQSWVYETLLQPAEWLLVFQTDSMLCANSKSNLNDYLGYDWVGAPWNLKASFGGNGGLSLRRVSSIIEVLRNNSRPHGGPPEDVFLSNALNERPGARMANGRLSSTFSGEMHSGQKETIAHWFKGSDGENSEGWIEGIDDWREGFYEPMGFHTGASGTTLHGAIWGTPQLRAHMWNYCPEIKLILQMDVAQYVPGDCGAIWKREDGDGMAYNAYATEVIDGVEYPLVPNLIPW